MRKLLLFALWAATLLRATAGMARAEEMITASQLEARLAAEHGHPDDAIAQRLSSLGLTERLSTARLQRLEAELPGTKSRHALVALADYSAFLSPPPGEIPDLAPPTHAAAVQIADKAVKYLVQAIPALPNYMATRTTNRFESSPTWMGGVVVAHPMHFEDAPAGPIDSNKEVPEQPLRWIGISKEIVTVRDGSEFVEPADSRKKKRSAYFYLHRGNQRLCMFQPSKKGISICHPGRQRV